MKNLALLLSLLFNYAIYSQAVTQDLKAHFKFDGDVLDASGNNEDLNNPLFPNYSVFSGSDSAFYFDGSTRLISKTQFNNSAYTEASISMWVRVDTPSSNSKQMFVQGAFMKFGVFLTPTNNVAAFFDTPSRNALIDTTDISDGNWHHLVGQNNGDSTFLYLDGQFKGKKYQPFNVGNGASNNKLYLGNTNLNTYPYSGSINDLRIYNRILTQAEIDTLSTFPMTVGISESNTKGENQILAYPNPTNGQFFVKLNESNLGGQLFVRDILGKLVYQQINLQGTQVELEINQSRGVYFLEVINRDGQKSTIKIIKQ